MAKERKTFRMKCEYFELHDYISYTVDNEQRGDKYGCTSGN